MISQAEQLEAQKRVELKRHLSVMRIPFHVDMPTPDLQRLVEIAEQGFPPVHRFPQPMTSELIEKLAEPYHYIRNLVAMKIMFGLNQGIGVVVGPGTKTVQLRTVRELVAHQMAPKSMIFLDDHMHKLKLLKYHGGRNNQ
jgi:hypothetical protein